MAEGGELLPTTLEEVLKSYRNEGEYVYTFEELALAPDIVRTSDGMLPTPDAALPAREISLTHSVLSAAVSARRLFGLVSNTPKFAPAIPMLRGE